MKVKIDPKRNLKIFLIAFLVCGAILFLCCISIFVFSWPWTALQYCVIAIYVILSLLLLFASFKTCYYVVENKYFEVVKFGKTVRYEYANVIYIDEEKSVKTKTISFMTKFDKTPRYVHFDKNNVLYNKMLEKCNNRMSRDDFYREHPDISF